MSAAWIQELDILHYCRWPLSFMPIGPLWWFFSPSPSPQRQMPAQSKSGSFPCEKQEQKSANLISCAVLSTVTVGKRMARQTTLLVEEWYQVHHGNLRNICNKSHTMQEKKNGVSILNMLNNTAGLLSLHFRMTSLIFLYESNYSITSMLPVIRNY